MRKLDRNYNKRSEMVADGWTEQELLELQNAPRSRAAKCDDPNGPFTWPLVDGYRILYSCFTADEKKLYNPWYKAHHSGSGSGGTTAADEAKIEQFKRLKEELVKLNASAEVMALLDALTPKKKNALFEQLFGVADVADLKGNPTLDYCMYVGPNGERLPLGKDGTLAKAIELWGAKLQCINTKETVMAGLKKLADKGIFVRFADGANLFYKEPEKK